jgi:hypothetical protein
VVPWAPWAPATLIVQLFESVVDDDVTSPVIVIEVPLSAVMGPSIQLLDALNARTRIPMASALVVVLMVKTLADAAGVTNEADDTV